MHRSHPKDHIYLILKILFWEHYRCQNLVQLNADLEKNLILTLFTAVLLI